MIPVITVDGPSGSGKGTLCTRLSEKLGFFVLDSGALYRIVGLSAHRAGLLFQDAPQNTAQNLAPDTLQNASKTQASQINEQAVVQLIDELHIEFDYTVANKRIVVNGDDVTHIIRTEEVGSFASKVAAIGAVRSALLDLQKSFAKPPGLIADGRDMGTVVFPDAILKIYLTASSEERAKRRVNQLQQMGKPANISAILADIQARDARDMSRSVAPLKPAKDACVLDSSSLSIDDVTNQVLAHCTALGLL